MIAAVIALLLGASASATTPVQAPAAATAAVTKRYAIVVGFNGEGGERRPLSYGDDDAARFFLQQLPGVEKAWLLTTFDAASARAFPDLAAVARAPTREELSHVLGELAWSVRDAGTATTELTFYFAGHGDVDPAGEGYIVFADGALSRTELYTHVVKGSPAAINHVVIDACASFFMVARGGEATSARVALSPSLLDVLDDRQRDDAAAWARTGVLVSTSDSSEVHETSELGSGVFSYLLRSALSGAADENGDGKVEYAETAAFIAAASASIADPRAHLRVHAHAPAQRPNSALVDLAGGRIAHFLSIDGAGPGHVRILDARGIPYAELNRSPGKDVLVSLVGNAFYIVQLDDKEAVLVPRSSGAYALSSLAFTRRVQGSARSAAGGTRLFETPFGRDFLTAYLVSSALPDPYARAPLEVPFAVGAEPAFAFPWRGVAIGTFATAGGFAAVALGAAAGNMLTYGALEQEFASSATVDPALAMQVELWRAVATSAGALALATGLGGVALWWVADSNEEDAQ